MAKTNWRAQAQLAKMLLAQKRKKQKRKTRLTTSPDSCRASKSPHHHASSATTPVMSDCPATMTTAAGNPTTTVMSYHFATMNSKMTYQGRLLRLHSHPPHPLPHQWNPNPNRAAKADETLVQMKPNRPHCVRSSISGVCEVHSLPRDLFLTSDIRVTGNTTSTNML